MVVAISFPGAIVGVCAAISTFLKSESILSSFAAFFVAGTMTVLALAMVQIFMLSRSTASGSLSVKRPASTQKARGEMNAPLTLSPPD